MKLMQFKEWADVRYSLTKIEEFVHDSVMNEMSFMDADKYPNLTDEDHEKIDEIISVALKFMNYIGQYIYSKEELDKYLEKKNKRDFERKQLIEAIKNA